MPENEIEGVIQGGKGMILKDIRQRVRDLPLRSKGLAVIAIPLAGLLAVVIAFYLVQRANQDAEEWVRHTLEVRSQIQMVRSALDEAESGVRGYLLTRDETWLEPYRRAERRLPGMLSRLEGMAGDNPAQLAQVRHIRELVAARFRQLPQSVELRGGAPPQAALVASREQLQRIRADLDALWREENRLLGLRQEHARQVRGRAYAVIIAGMLFIPAGAVLAMLLFTNVIVHRVQVLEENANRLARGSPVAPWQSGRDEIGALEHSLGEAAALLSRRERDLQTAKAELERRVDERTAELARANEALAAEVAERKRAEEALAYANARLRAVIEASPVAIVGLDLAGNVTSWNRAAERIFGWTAGEAIDRPLPSLPDEELRNLYSVLSAAAEGGVLSGFETRRRRKDGSLVDLRLWTAPLRNQAGELRGQIAIAADFTEQRRLEQQFAQAQKMEAIGRLAGGVAHDFNNVITVVSGYGQLLLDSLRENPDLADAAQEILKAADRAAMLASQLLAFSRRQMIQPRVVDLNDLIGNVHRMLGRVIGEDIELKTVLAPDLARVKADPGQIEQVLMNLVVNARDAMPAGGRILIETANAHLDESYTAVQEGVVPGPYAMLAVSDTGSGMNPETRAHLFEPFFTTKEKGKGTGLGLSTVYGIVKQHRGDIWVYSEPGKGSTFKVYLPQVAASTAAEAVAPTKPAPAPLGGNETVLLVEDEAGVRKLIRDILELRGYRVLEADSGQRALQVAGEHEARIDLLVTDVVMPKMGGRELAEALVLLRPDLKVLFLSGYTDQLILDRSTLPFGSDFLPKPFSQEALARKVRAVLDRGMRAAG